MNFRLICALALAFGAGAAAVDAQGLPGTNLTTTIRVRGASMAHDSTSLSYSLLVGGTSVERFFIFGLAAPVPPLSMGVASDTAHWLTLRGHGDLSILSWANLPSTAQGDSTPTLSLVAIGLPGIETAWLHGDSIVSEPSDTSTPPSYDLFTNLSQSVQTVGIDPRPTDPGIVDSLLFTRLHALTDSSCHMGWITSGSLCTLLDAVKKPSAYVFHIDTAWTNGVSLNGSAYYLLRANANYIATFVDTSTVQLNYICGTKYRVRNYSWATFHGTWTTTGEVHSGDVSVVGRTEGAPGYAETDVLSGGTSMSLYYNGALLRTATNGGTTCP